jgi:hypothetical protein
MSPKLNGIGLWLIGVAIGSACNPHPERRAGPGELDVVDVWSTSRRSSGAEFSTIQGMAISVRGEVWAVDGRAGDIEILFDTGRPRKAVRFDGFGGVPEFTPLHVARYADRMVVLDTRNAIHILDADGYYLGTTPLRTMVLNPKGFAGLPDGSFLVTGGSVDSDRSIFRFDSTGQLEVAWHSIPRAANPESNRAFSNARMVAGGPIGVARDGSILYSEAAPHRILRFGIPDTIGNLLAADEALLPPIVNDFDAARQIDGETVWLPRWDFPRSTGVFEMPDGRVVNVITLPEERVSIWEVYEPDGTLVARRDVYRMFRAWAIDTDGAIAVSERIGGRSRVGLVRLEIREGEP